MSEDYWIWDGLLDCFSGFFVYLFLVDGDPVSGRVPLVVLDVVDAVLQVAVTFR